MASRERRTSGAFYTPHALVDELTTEALAALLARAGIDDAEAQRIAGGGPPAPADIARVRAHVTGLRLLDPACGSGAFLVHALERVGAIVAACGDERDAGAVRREVVARSIFGVDANPMAVWLCELRLWLSTVIETDVADGARVPTLPNLDHNIRVGDSLSGQGFAANPRDAVAAPGAVAALRARYARSSGIRKASLARALERLERGAAIAALDREVAAIGARRRELLLVLRQRDLFGARGSVAGDDLERVALRDRLRAARDERRRLAAGGPLPFSYPACFVDAGAPGGFDLVIGNPPWVRLHNIPQRARARLRDAFSVFRLAAWEQGAAGGGAGRGFAAQVDLAALFVERAVDLLGPRGVLAFLLPAKLWRSLAGGGVRRLLAGRCPVLLLEDLSDATPAFDAAVYPSILVAARGGPAPVLQCGIRARDQAVRWKVARAHLALDETPGSPWLIAPPEVRRAFERLRRGATPLAESVAGRPLLGVKTGCNEAFVIPDDRDRLDPSLGRPLVRGETLTPWAVAPRERLLWTHDAGGAPLRSLPAAALRHLAPFRRVLERRADLRGGARWWSLFRLESARHDAARVVWADVGRSPRAACLAPGDPTVALNSCYVARLPSLDDALALTALLNSPLLAAWLSLVAEPARGGYHRFLGWTLAIAPLPADWPRARAILAPLGARGAAGDAPSAHELLEAAVAAYRVRAADLAPLVAWAHR